MKTTCSLILSGVLILISGLAPFAHAQETLKCWQQNPGSDLRDLVRKLLKKKEPEATAEQRKVSLQIIPYISSNPALGVSFGAAMSAVGYRESEEENVNSVTASASFSTKSQFLLVTRSDLTMHSSIRMMGDWRFYKYTDRTYGLGTNTSKDSFEDVRYKWVRFRESAVLPVTKNFGMGLEYDLEQRFGIGVDTDEPSVSPPQAIPFESGDTTSSGIGFVAIYDNTDNRINASRGLNTRISYRFYPTWIGSDDAWQMLDAEARYYILLPTCKRQVLAFWALTQMVTSGNPPYFDLPGIGWDTYNRSGRGYAVGRFRGHGWLYGEIEYRRDLTQNGFLGMVAFTNVSSFTPDDTLQFQGVAPAGGLGLRVKIDKKTGSNLAVDFGYGKDKSKSLYIAFNETF